MSDPLMPPWWNADEALSILEGRFARGLSLVSSKCDWRGVPCRSLRFEHADYLPSGDRWKVLGNIRMPDFESITTVQYWSSLELEVAFRHDENAFSRHHFSRVNKWLTTPNCGRSDHLDLSFSVLVTPEMVEAVTELLRHSGWSRPRLARGTERVAS